MRPNSKSNRPGVKALACSAVLVAATALAGCGGGSQKPAALGTSAAAATGSTSVAASSPAASSSSAAASSAPSTSASASGTGDYAAFPGFTPPADLKDIVDPAPSTGDPVKDKILADNAQVLRAYDVWSTTGDYNTPGISTYLGSGMRASYQAQFAQYHAAGKAPAGTVRYYDRKIISNDGHTARVLDCEDGRQAFDKYVSTGKQVPGSVDGIMAFYTTVIKDSAGVWQAQSFNKQTAPTVCAAP